MDEEKIKTAFTKVKEDILNLHSQIQELSHEINDLKRTLEQTDTPDRQTDRQEIQTVPLEVGGSKPQNLPVSTGNQGVQTDRQTNRQTDRHVQKFALINESKEQQDQISRIERVSEALSTLDSIKKDLRSQFKRLTPQEMLVFSTIYQLENQGLIVDYALLAQKINLSESSIRDYVLKLIKKGIPVGKSKENNKQVRLSIFPDLKKIASLDTIIALRDL